MTQGMMVAALQRSLNYLPKASPKTPLMQVRSSCERPVVPRDEGHVPLGASYEQPACKGACIPACSAPGFH